MSSDPNSANRPIIWARSLRARLLALVLVVMAAGIGVVALQAVNQIKEHTQHEVAERLEADVSLLAEDIERAVNLRKTTLEQVSNVVAPLLAANEAVALQRFLEARPILNGYFNRGTFVVDARGVALASSPAETGRTDINYADHDYMIAALQGGETHVGRPALGKPVGTPVLVMAAPVRLQGRIVGAVAGVIDLNMPSFLNRLQDFAAIGNRQIVVIDSRSGLVVASSDTTLIMQPGKVPAAFKGVVTTVLEKDSLVSVKAISSTGWVLQVSTPLAIVQTAGEKMQNRILGSVGEVVLVAALLALWALAVLLGPLARASLQLSRWTGNGAPFTTRSTQWPDEIGQLTQQFNLAIERTQQHEQTLEQSNALMESAGKMALVGGWELDVLTKKLFFTGQTYRIFDLDPSVEPTIESAIGFFAAHSQQAMKEAFQNAIESGTPFDLDTEMVTAKGHPIWVRLQGQAVSRVGRVIKLRGAFQDITRSKVDEKQISNLAFADTLTGLPNRRLLVDRLEIALASSRRHAHSGAMLVIDLDNFKLLNDSYGHFKGDLLLKAVAENLAAIVRKDDTVARVGADEFMVLLTNLSGKPEEAVDQARAFAEKLLNGLRRNYLLGRLHHYSTASIGVTLFSAEQEAPEEPMKRADLAMMQVRNSGGNAMRFFEPQMQAAIERRVELEAAMRAGLANNEFMLYYQPQLFQSGESSKHIVGAESLIRWKSAQQGMISPGEFIPVAEESGMILELGQWVLESACEQLARWANHPALAQLTLAVNVSARQFHQIDFVARVLQALTTSGADPLKLKLELTEGLLVSNLDDVVIKMKSLKKLGVCFSLDDFGTGFSSLSYLKRLPLDQLKIDQGFIRDILTNAHDAAIARTVIALANSLGLSIIAEGVETEEQRRFLASEGCLTYQGYLFSRPVPADDFEAIVIAHIDPLNGMALAA